LIAGWSSPVARQAHNLKAVGSNPTPATNFRPFRFSQWLILEGFFLQVFMEPIYAVYILRNAMGTLYIGLTEDVAKRLSQHNDGVSKWTRGKGPWDLIWKRDGLSLSQARKLELELKRQKGGEGLYRLTGLERSSGS
jgi:predicted GIY-YIG superfamily endonuclease